jgi:hypothetical protein
MSEFVSIKKYLDDLVKIHIICIRDSILKDRELIDWCLDNLYITMNTTIPNVSNNLDDWSSKPFAYTGIGQNVSFGTLDCKTTTIDGTLSVSGMIYGTAQHALYSDLAEYYSSTIHYPVGSLVAISTSSDPHHEIDLLRFDLLDNYLGVISSNPAFVMNQPIKEQEGIYHIPIGLIGRIPTLVSGPINKGQHIGLSVDHPGVAVVHTGCCNKSLGIALESKTSEGIGLVLCMIK